MWVCCQYASCSVWHILVKTPGNRDYTGSSNPCGFASLLQFTHVYVEVPFPQLLLRKLISDIEVN